MKERNGLDSCSNDCRWGIILAGGETKRMRRPIKEWLGYCLPKQFCTFTGTRSMLQHTIDRAKELIPEERLVIVTLVDYQGCLEECIDSFKGTILYQPSNRDTAPAIMLGLSHILERDPEGVVAVFPSDHFIYPEDRFVSYVDLALNVCEKEIQRMVFLGAIPSHPESGYGWIKLGDLVEESFSIPASDLLDVSMPGTGLLAADRLWEKPNRSDADWLFRDGWVLNTKVIAAKARTLYAIAWQWIPNILRRFETYRSVLHAVTERRAPEDHLAIAMYHLYLGLRPVDFFLEVAQNAFDRTLVLPMDAGLHWSDWQHPDRVRNSLEMLNLRSDFQLTKSRERPIPAPPVQSDAGKRLYA